MSITPQNILIIHFGQVGDVILSLPALQAIKDEFAHSKITIACGKTSKTVVEMSGLADEIIAVDRYAIRDGNRLWALREIYRIIRRVRRGGFDLAIDIHSLYETNILGFLSGAKSRLYANRGNRSLDFLSNFKPKPVVQNRSIHKTEDYLSILGPLRIEAASRIPRIIPDPEDVNSVLGIFESDGLAGKRLIGMNPGAGNPSRKWKLENFARVAESLSADEDIRVLVFLGPEERQMERDTARLFPAGTVVYKGFDLKKLAAACTHLELFLSNDTGPIHLAAAVGAPTLLLAGYGGHFRYLPVGPNAKTVGNVALEDLGVEEVLEAVNEVLHT
ncbi:MAG: glycosyltransferase family 9 protein [Acidobacteriota bacterium]|nr:glycosyltransferase family 9 protein [Acidobacteriota bacterium]MDH3529368.1 glycosyltransferase family 9 protein [Acidobacteriota bacterium]